MLSKATNAFSDQNIIAKGGFGKVYKGVSVKHGNIAIKMLDPTQGQGDHEFKTEIALLSVYKHENIVSLLGFCDEDGKKILVYKHESNGSLDRYLHSANLTWIQRLQICLDAARGLQYLHDDVGLQHRILHRDIKSSNILLDENWKAKVSDFGLSRVGPANMESTFVISNACGTSGYIDPEYLISGYLTQKSDVYSFGVVLFEVLCGRLTYVKTYHDERQYLTNLIRIHWGRKTLDEIIFSNIKKQMNGASLLTFSSIAYQCLMSGNERPTMKKVVEQLQKALDEQLTPSGSWSHTDGYAAHRQEESRLVASSSSQPSPASSSLKYDVFISSREEDTFADHLYSALVHRQIFTLLPQGKTIRPSLFEAIQDSQIVIVIFSLNYASSSWCLDELELIMENRHKRGQIVIPVFYGVEPSEVVLQTSYYLKALAMPELNMNKVESWRKALVEATNLSGWDADWNELKLIKKICDDISYKLLRSGES
ncbi:receptor-like protein kinase ANXUR2 [Helianthus annuus]|nr:receptor-like protein kinase ANXUR2 [Helianthus annuus]